uniref:NAD(P)(+)--arginine ADP-ribosyltransferase n=1 Tax=Melopsittacus undulatus TaxID=13146 RepID=A0A8V5GPM2_MELUD
MQRAPQTRTVCAAGTQTSSQPGGKGRAPELKRSWHRGSGSAHGAQRVQAHPCAHGQLPMDMAPDAFDDRYEGCERRMELELPELNRTEFSTNSVYAEGWSRAARAWQQSRVPQPPGLRPEHAVALMAGRSGHRYRHTFPFKALHFLLSQALSTLQSTQRRCHRHGQRVRFGHFTSASLNNGSGFICGTFGCDTLFTVHTCWGALIRDFSLYSMEEEILIPPSEVFQVTSAVLTGHRSLIQLQSQGINSTYNCELLRGADPMGWGVLPGNGEREWGWRGAHPIGSARNGGNGEGVWVNIAAWLSSEAWLGMGQHGQRPPGALVQFWCPQHLWGSLDKRRLLKGRAESSSSA